MDSVIMSLYRTEGYGQRFVGSLFLIQTRAEEQRRPRDSIFHEVLPDRDLAPEWR